MEEWDDVLLDRLLLGKASPSVQLVYRFAELFVDGGSKRMTISPGLA